MFTCKYLVVKQINVYNYCINRLDGSTEIFLNDVFVFFLYHIKFLSNKQVS